VCTHTHSTLFTADRVGVGSQRDFFGSGLLTPGTRIARSTLGSMVELQVLAAGTMELLCRPCVDCRRVTGRFCDYCFAADRMPEQTWADNQLTPFCSQCEETHVRCKYCRQDLAARTPRTGTQRREAAPNPADTAVVGHLRALTTSRHYGHLVGLPAASAATGLGHGGGGAPTGTYDSPATTINGKPVFGPVPPPGLIEQLVAERAAAAQHR